jgi:hypothetical protein
VVSPLTDLVVVLVKSSSPTALLRLAALPFCDCQLTMNLVVLGARESGQVRLDLGT